MKLHAGAYNEFCITWIAEPEDLFYSRNTSLQNVLKSDVLQTAVSNCVPRVRDGSDQIIITVTVIRCEVAGGWSIPWFERRAVVLRLTEITGNKFTLTIAQLRSTGLI